MMVRSAARALLLLLVAAATFAWPSSASAARFVDIAAGGRATCGVTASGSTWCWGDGRQGQLGRIGQLTARTPKRVIGTYDSRQITAGTSYACQLLDRGKQIQTRGIFACWGSNARGQIGDGREQRALFPQEIRSPGGLTRVEAGASTACALGAGGIAYCWGENAVGQTGDGATRPVVRRPQLVPGVSGLVDIAIGDQHVCGVRADGGVVCWGWTRNGRTAVQLRPLIAPEPVPGLGDVVDVAAGASHSCVLRRAGGGTVWCFGLNQRGQLGVGTGLSQASSPVQVAGLSGITRIDADAQTTCAVGDRGRVWCWGYGGTGQLGTGTRADASTPRAVADLADVVRISVGDAHVCALTRGGAPYCWGSNRYGQLGNGDRTGLGVRVLAPRLVVDRELGRATFVPRSQQSFPSGTSGGTVELRGLIARKTSSRFACPRTVSITITTQGRSAKRTAVGVTRRSATSCRISGTFPLPARTAEATSVRYAVRDTHLRTATGLLRAQRAG